MKQVVAYGYGRSEAQKKGQLPKRPMWWLFTTLFNAHTVGTKRGGVQQGVQREEHQIVPSKDARRPSTVARAEDRRMELHGV